MESKETNLRIEVSVDYHGQRADKVLSALCDLSRSRLQSLIKEGAVLLNDKILKSASFKVSEGDVFLLHIPEPIKAEPSPENIPLDIVYEDEDMLVVNKQVGLVVHPGAGNWSGTMVNALLYHCGSSLSGIGGVIRPGIVHRLDKDTSGLILVAKNDSAHQALSAQLADRSLSRVYHALITGVPMPFKGVVDRPIGRHRHSRLKMSVVSAAPRDARTHYKVIQSFGEACSLVECRLETGRTHQIRVHMEALKHPLVGDHLYGPQPTLLKSKLKKEKYDEEIIEEILNFPRQALHARELKCVHPRTEKQLSFIVQMPDDFSNLLKLL
ncbi:MAG: RluA family pseudouridine synthase [Alphaproteobacteria bacterium]|nr:RluA family pseudouridine synthase [Alphaproteobacteria bacterium]